ncbi:hypothetical protein PHMEG_00010802 [Phytophthora megakarya]|uniref:Eukaryotic/viral aspartic protease n=1 Tax=Phytophthora megakarya TaxID=4795 RepID=A0A225WFA0_9STRA|nr:hypothetical protein PHMEG_00010802 [Phytophthora megakarya]
MMMKSIRPTKDSAWKSTRMAGMLRTKITVIFQRLTIPNAPQQLKGHSPGPTSVTTREPVVTSTPIEAMDETARKDENSSDLVQPVEGLYYCFKRCKLCKQVHDAGKCEAFAELINLLRSKVDKRDLTPELQSLSFKLGSPPIETGLVPIGLPQLTESVVDADYMFAFAGEVEWPDGRDNIHVNKTKIVEERASSRSESERRAADDDNRANWQTTGVECSLARVQPGGLNVAARLLPGERLGWWSAQRYDKRKRMRALVMGAVNDVRTKIVLDTRANVSVVSASHANRLRLRDVPDHG